jgi:hypothetical protein
MSRRVRVGRAYDAAAGGDGTRVLVLEHRQAEPDRLQQSYRAASRVAPVVDLRACPTRRRLPLGRNRQELWTACPT